MTYGKVVAIFSLNYSYYVRKSRLLKIWSVQKLENCIFLNMVMESYIAAWSGAQNLKIPIFDLIKTWSYIYDNLVYVIFLQNN